MYKVPRDDESKMYVELTNSDVQEAISKPGVFNFDKFFTLLCDQNWQKENPQLYRKLCVFAFGTLKDYRDNVKIIGALTDAELEKLKQQTLFSICAAQNTISYDVLKNELGEEDEERVETFIIDCILKGYIVGKLSQKDKVLRVALVRIHRDIAPETQQTALTFIETTLTEWIEKLNKSQQTLQKEIEYLKETGDRLDREFCY